MSSSAAPGWTEVDVVLHLAQSEETVVATVTGAPAMPGRLAPDRDGLTVDECMDRWIVAERAGPEVVYPRWQAARRADEAATALHHAARGLRDAHPDLWRP